MKQFHSLATLLTLLAGLMLGGAAIAAEHGGDAVDSGSESGHSDSMDSHDKSSTKDKSSKGEEHGGKPAESEDSGQDGKKDSGHPES